jgi:transcriptional regulator with XRE-family HTH domain
MTPEQFRMGRAAAGLSIEALARKAAVSPTAIDNLERGGAVSASSVQAVRAVLEAAGVIFLEDDGNGPGVRLRRPGAAAAPNPAAPAGKKARAG